MPATFSHTSFQHELRLGERHVFLAPEPLNLNNEVQQLILPTILSGSRDGIDGRYCTPIRTPTLVKWGSFLALSVGLSCGYLQ